MITARNEDDHARRLKSHTVARGKGLKAEKAHYQWEPVAGFHNTHIFNTKPLWRADIIRDAKMILHEDDSQSIANAVWQMNATQIAEWQICHMVNRTDQATYWTADGWRAVPGDVADELRKNCRGLSPTVTYSHSVDGLCKWVCLDFDNHDSDPDVAQRNMNMATGILNSLTELGVVSGLEDSDGQGGLHLWVLFSPAIEIECAYRFAKFLRSDHPKDDIETNPKQRSAKSWGNGVRLPGHHHKRAHMSRFWGDGAWLDAHDSVELMLNLPTNDPDVLSLMGDYDPDRKLDPPPRRVYAHRPMSGNGGRVSQAEAHIESIPWPDLLRDCGWHGQGKFWTRPGKEHGVSATLDHHGNGLLYVFSANAGLPVEASDKAGAAFGKWRFWIHQAGFNDVTQRDAAERYLNGVTR
jgi:hypothetical protein